MRRPGSRALAALVAAAVLTACGDETGAGPDGPVAYSADDDRSEYVARRQKSDFDRSWPEPYNDVVDLPDGRRVAMFYAEDRGLAEQHYSPDADAWTEPRIIFATEEHPCQGIALDQAAGTVAVFADWGIWCYDGEPPEQSVAAVATGDLTEWTTDLTEGFDGWTHLEVADDGAGVEWTQRGDSNPVDRLTWSPADGFDKDRNLS